MRNLACFALALATPQLAVAQLPSLGSLGGAGGLGALGGKLPAIGSVGAGNAAGLLGYCIKQKLLGGSGGAASGVLGKLAGNPDVAGSPGFAAGQNGQVVSGGSQFSLASAGDTVKKKLCSLVLDRAQSFAAR